MHRFIRKPRPIAAGLAAIVIAIGALLAAGTAAGANDNRYVVHNLVSDGFLPADHFDSHLVNSWGIAAGPSTPWWVANNGTGTSTLYNGDGVAQPPPPNGPLVVSVDDDPTGVVFNGGSGFVINDGHGNTGAAKFIFATENGQIYGWSPGVPPPPLSKQAFLAPNDADQSATGAVFKGLAIASTPTGDMLYATDFHNGKVDVFDSTFTLQNIHGAFVDPKLPKGFAPFGIQNIGGNIFVTYAKQDADRHDDVPGHGNGFVDEYSNGGALLARVGTRGALNSPWGIAMAPASGFGQASGHLVVGNFGNGHVLTFKTNKNGKWEPGEQLRGTNGKPIVIDGLWGIGFGNGNGSGDPNDLYFASGPDGEHHGLFGEISAASG